MTDLVSAWTGRTACALQAALRLTNEGFARHLGVASRTVASWHQRPETVPKTEMQQVLDTALERASENARARFARLVTTELSPARPITIEAGAATGHALTVAIAVVVKASEVLIVQRRDNDGPGISWQFPAGVVKPGSSPDTVAVRETLAETGIHCRVVRNLGSRLHPLTEVHCDYLLCEYLTGEPENLDPAENVSVIWAATELLTRFIPTDRIFPPILEALEAPGDGSDS
jgi:8-oxo-dGTP pyrophosphatase MutT (NUDIX family)/DNA-binding transcriptional regulator YiaG